MDDLPQVRTPSNQFVTRTPEVQMERQMSDYQIKTALAEQKKLKYYTDQANTERYIEGEKEVFINLSLVEIAQNFVRSMIGILNDLTDMKDISLRQIISILTRDDRLIYLGILFILIGLSLVTF